ncbi:MAG: agmatinase [Mesorhizobium sp.]|uniref:agmatinase n=1 Tax=unclassified Mesorhizobium TaxID=325217 RepID=UPI000FCA5B7D|nr:MULTISPECIES: agmatinase [unclassified Mesorhizobium]RUX46860.1 agmatinase [Mesorhizobium sp. M4A.F.Ca.ET.050.02.1.1]RVD31990.1 agmatinase [Mesorhizobium sp. M4A.F.Ca.ET.020.02.1.1]RWC14123.1 MAG: agmatinase [Mesorhizobium sp.]RWD03456.1 MAG: agmatinase [Mesorhizobium sp.]RWD26153.1 MAG: agmatinase [Mesorhizobium sp.]
MSKISLLGIPHDENSSWLRGAAEAPPLIRRELTNDAYSSWSETGFDLSDRFIDHGDIDFAQAGDPWERIEDEVGRALDAGHPLISLGGDHAISWPLLRAVRRRHPSLTILHIDAHPDIYHAYDDNPRSHTSPFARIMEERLADRLIQVGLRTVNDHHRDQFKRFGVEVVEMRHFKEGLRLDHKTPVYVSMDIDALDPAFAPGISHREPGGFTTRQVIGLIQSIDQPIVAADVVEYNPRQDLSNVTALVAAKLVKEIAGMMLKTNGATAG